jgi:hypothetical protein
MLKLPQAETERIRLEQYEALKCITESSRLLMAELVGGGDTIKPEVGELQRIANYLVGHT